MDNERIIFFLSIQPVRGGELDLPDKKGVAEVIPDGQTLTTGGEG